ncbi:MAG: peptide ABC transporter substrate-binding protein [Myxococcales bacterium]|nr:peptide ABC transporter substrate-binding protein [Myxococcales bacterium]
MRARGSRANRTSGAGLPALIACAVALGGCPRRGPPPRDTLILGTTRDLSTFDPAFTQLSSEQEVVRLLFRDLTTLDDDWALVPDLAEALPTVTATGGDQMVEWRLRPGLKWSDGHPLTASDVRFGWQIEANSALAAVSHDTAARVRRFEVEDPQRFRVVFRGAFADYAAPRVHAVLPAHAYPKPSPDRPFAGMTEDPISSGPFRVKEHVRGQHLILERNPFWAGPAPGLARVVFRFFPSEDGFEAALATGAIHALGEASGLTPDRVSALRDRLKDTHRVVAKDGGVLLHLDVRHQHPALGRPEVRRALLAAVDREGLAQVTYDGLATPADGLFPPRHPGFDPELPTVAHDPAAARVVISALPADQRTWTLTIGAGSQAAARAGAFLKDALEAAGARVTLRTLPMKVLFEAMEAGTQDPLVLFAWRVRPDWDGASVVGAEGRQNPGGYASPEMDALLARVAATVDPTARAPLLRAIDARFRADLPAIPLLFRQTVSVVPKDLAGWRPTGTATPVTWNAEAWRFPE